MKRTGKVHWKPISYCFPAACGLPNPRLYKSQDSMNVAYITCKTCKRLLLKWKTQQSKAGTESTETK